MVMAFFCEKRTDALPMTMLPFHDKWVSLKKQSLISGFLRKVAQRP
jgi:hypothetical protein